MGRLFRKHYGVNGDPVILVAKGATRDLNPLPRVFRSSPVERDHASGKRARIYGRVPPTGILRRSCRLKSFRPAPQRLDVRERPPLPGVMYQGFCDPSGGSSDSMALAIGHNDLTRETIVVDAIREMRPPFSPEQVVQEFAAFSSNRI